MMYVLDTNVLSELRKVRFGKADVNVTAWSGSVDAADFWGNGASVAVRSVTKSLSTCRPPAD